MCGQNRLSGAVKFPCVSVIILNWNNAPDTLECIDSVVSLDYPNFTIVVVDNGSTDGSVSVVKARFPEITVLENNDNLGYAEGNNIGIRYALEHGADYALVLNNDTVVDSKMLMELVAVARSVPLAGMVGPKVCCLEQPNTIMAAGSKIDWKRGIISHLDMGQRESELSREEATPRKADFLIGCCYLASRQMIERVGILDARFYLNFEDIDWCIRVARAGFRVLYAPKAKIWHRVSATLGLGSPANTYYMTRNALLFFRIHAPGIWKFLAPLKIMLRTLRTIGAWTLKSKYRTGVFRRKRDANILALRDFFLSRFGRMGTDVARVCYGR